MRSKDGIISKRDSKGWNGSQEGQTCRVYGDGSGDTAFLGTDEWVAKIYKYTNKTDQITNI